MKIAMVCDISIGGGKRHVEGLSQYLERRGNDVHIIAYDKMQNFKSHVMRSIPITYHYNLLLGKKNLMNIIKEIDPDIVHFHHIGGTADFAIRNVKKEFPTVSTMHVAPSSGSLFDLIMKIYYRMLFHQITNSDRIICVSNCVRDWVIKSGIPENKVVTINNGIDTKRFKPTKDWKAKKNGRLELLFVGRLTPEKGIRTLFNTFSILKKNIDVGLTIVGSGPLKNLCRMKARMDKNIRFLGEISDDDLIKEYSSADIVTVPSLWQEAFGLVILEAMSCETPPIAFRVGGIPEIISHNVNGFLVDKKDPLSLASGILDATNQNLVRIGRYARKDVTRRYNWKNIAKQTEDVYISIL